MKRAFRREAEPAAQRYRTGSQTTKTDQTQDTYEMMPLAHAAHCAVERERE